MTFISSYRILHACLVLFTLHPILLAHDSTPAVALELDAREAPRRILHARLLFKVRPGDLTLLYPKWIPGEHGPTGPISDLAGVRISALGHPIAWSRDPLEMYTFRTTVPNEATELQVDLDFLLSTAAGGFSAGASSTDHLTVISWNHIVLYPRGARADEIQYAARLHIPEGWHFGTALSVSGHSADRIDFAPVSLTTLVDSPVLLGRHFRTLDLSPTAEPAHRLHLAADSAAALQMRPEDQSAYQQLVLETGSLFGARHYHHYNFLLALSDAVAHFGLEHHQSSDNRAPERALVDDELRQVWAGLLPHEVVHSWNGKYRRPAEMVTPDFQQPLNTERLWVYEGLTSYLGEVLTVRSGLISEKTHRQTLAFIAATFDHRSGRAWRPLRDTTAAAQILYGASPGWRAWRRGVDFYEEGQLIWLEADTVIREKTGGTKSLDDFCQRFFGGQNTPPEVRPYSEQDLWDALNQTVEHDWPGFFRRRIADLNPHAPMAGIERAGWRLVYTEQLPDYLKAVESADKLTDLTFSIGLQIAEDGLVRDVIPGLPAAKAGIGPGMKLLAVNGRRWSPRLLREAIKAAASPNASLELLIENAEFIRAYPLDYHQGERYPQLERISDKPDLLSQILKPRAGR